MNRLEMDDFLAEKVMGYHRRVSKSKFGSSLWNNYPDEFGLSFHFQPTITIEDAIECLQKVKTKNRRIVIEQPMGETHFVCRIYEEGEIIAGAGSDSSMAVAISMCILKVKNAL